MQVDRLRTEALSPAERAEMLRLCEAAFREPLQGYLEAIGPGTHLLGRAGGRLVSHLMIVPRSLQPIGGSALHTAYVELVATAPQARGNGHASALLRRVPELSVGFDVAALAPSDPAFYERLGWESWRGPLYVRKGGELVPTPGELVMVYRLPRTPRGLDLDRALSIEWRPGEIW
jgi:aminoglycoside 2'-N-acetyltransferase I